MSCYGWIKRNLDHVDHWITLPKGLIQVRADPGERTISLRTSLILLPPFWIDGSRSMPTDPRLVALLDQAGAADAETTSLIQATVQALASLGETPEQVSARAFHRRIQRRMSKALRGTLEAGTSPVCPHMRIDAPAPAVWLAWKPGRLRCVMCAGRASERIGGTREDHTCDSCRRYSPRQLKWGAYTLPPLLASIDPPLITPPVIVHYGICGRCDRRGGITAAG
jgi:hypothetical protein